MGTDGDEGETAMLSPDAAFATLGNETRMVILQTLGETSGPLSFSELRDRVGVRDSGQFNYHLDKLVGLFVDRVDAGYKLSSPGRRIVEAVLSGAVTERIQRSASPVSNWNCPYCGGTVEVFYRNERLERHCTECDGFLSPDDPGHAPPGLSDSGNLGSLPLPPAGVADRSASDMLRAAIVWGYSEFLTAAKGVCPRCSAEIDYELRVCEDHDTGVGFCTRCDERHAVRYRAICLNCPFATESAVSMYLGAHPAVLAFQLDHGFDPLEEPWDWGWEYEERVLSTDPFDGEFTFTADDESISLRVSGSLEVTDVRRSDIARD